MIPDTMCSPDANVQMIQIQHIQITTPGTPAKLIFITKKKKK